MRTGRINWTGVRGRNGGDSPLALPEWQAVEVMNMDFYRGQLGQKRAGSTTVALTSGPSGASDYPTALMRHVPGNDEGAAELWAATSTPAFYRLAAGTTWATVTASDTVTAATPVMGASLNGKLFLTYNSNVNRLHVWDGTRIRRVGMAQGGTPTVANTGAGTYAANPRYYKVAWVEKSGTVVVRRGELGPTSSLFTPSGGGTAARVTQPTPPGENETHWEVYGSADDVYSNYKVIGTVVVGTTTYDDSVNPASYAGDAPQQAGMNIPPPSAKFIISVNNRLLSAGAYESSAAAGQTVPKNNRVWHTRVLGSSDQGDDETIPNTSAVGITPAQKGWTDVGENDGGAITGLGDIEGIPFVFKQRQVWQLIPTGDDLQPFRPRNVTRGVGTLNQESIVLSEDQDGAPSLYFIDRRGPYRVSQKGLEYLGRDLEDITAILSPSAAVTAFGVAYSAKHQIWWRSSILTSAGVVPLMLVFDTQIGQSSGEHGIQGGWSRWSIPSTVFNPVCGVLFSATLGASMSVDLKPYLGGFDTSISLLPLLRKYDTGTDDVEIPYQAYIDSKPLFPAGMGINCRTDDAVLIAEDAAGVTIQLTTERDFGLETRVGTALLTPAASETHVIKRVSASGMAELGAVQFRLGDAAAISNAWTLEALSVPYTVQDARS